MPALWQVVVEELVTVKIEQRVDEQWSSVLGQKLQECQSATICVVGGAENGIRQSSMLDCQKYVNKRRLVQATGLTDLRSEILVE